MNIGPIIVRRVALDEVGGFNTSYSKPGQLGIGFDHEFIGRLWQAGWQSAVMYTHIGGMVEMGESI